MSVTVWDWYRGRVPTIRPGRSVRVPLAFLLAGVGQYLLRAGREGPWGAGVVLYLAAAALLGWAVWRDDTTVRTAAEETVEDLSLPVVRWRLLAVGVVLSGIAWFGVADNHVTLVGAAAWIASLLVWCAALWAGPFPKPDWRRLVSVLGQPRVDVRLSRTGLALLGILVVAALFRFSQLGAVPGEMTSDHVEKLLDVKRILDGARPVFLPTNGGREPMEFYLAAFSVRFLGAGITHLTLKTLMAVAGFITIPLVFLFAREVSDDDGVGLLAALMLAFAWWPNSISRNGLRFPLAPLFATLALWLVVRGLRRDRPNTLLLAGLALGIGFYGYTAIRIVPLAVTVAVVLHRLHRRSWPALGQSLARLFVLAAIAVAASVPLLRYASDDPEAFLMRTVTRVSSAETSLQASVPVLFAQNEWNSLRMFAWTSDTAWLVSPPAQPALDWITAAMFHLGVAFLVVRYAKHRDWRDLFLLVAIPILLLPSTLALAFPVENPSLHRSGGALAVVFVVAALALRLLLNHLQYLMGKSGTPSGQLRWAHAIPVTLAALVLGASAYRNYRILFDDYRVNYLGSAQNASEIGEVVRAFATTIGSWETASVRAYPYWVDTRAVGMYAGQFGWDQVFLDNESMIAPIADPHARLFIVHPDDAEAQDLLRQTYPAGAFSRYESARPNHDFLMFLVPAEGGQ